MPSKSKSTKRRTKVREISKRSKPLSKGDQKKVKGGGGGLFVAAGDLDGDTPLGIKSKTPR